MISISLSHLRSHENDQLSRQTMIWRSKALTQWMPVIPIGFFYLIVDGGWVWVILGLCWVCSSTDKTLSGWVWVILLKYRCGWFCWSMGRGVARRILLKDFVERWLAGCGYGSVEKTSLWVCSRGKEIIKNVKRMNILLNKYVE